ncbi:hypothetical protein KBB96_03010 [Luteolibacter ambystomatis]|uniref:Uncharacterized protein n=1 Tax=Luteolibacter ambystomatis TaxID=2824561 RepID=A0A975J0P2_9BACT|nr:hypothetical protein [Luteolibacter ambystomatis]QUE51868.1 hypothetical protein KBB96_03010 [Luteolibacter ambystomatis]
MNDPGTKRERRDRASGLIFAWRVGDTFHVATWMSVAIVILLGAFLLGTLKVRVVPPPRIIERKAAVVLVPNTADGHAWVVRAEEEGPFPARFRPADSGIVREMKEDLFRDPVSRPAYRAVLREFPQDTGPGAVQVAARGERVFPPQLLPESAPVEMDAQPLRPVLTLLAKLPADARPQELPPFPEPMSPEMAATTWQYMVEIGPGGRALRCVALDGGKPEGQQDGFARSLGSWLCHVRFGPGAAKAGWVGVEISFSRTP